MKSSESSKREIIESGHFTYSLNRFFSSSCYQTVTTNNFDGNGRWSRGEFNYDNKGNIDKQGYNMNSQMDNEVEDYMKGKSKYIKGKGWQ